MDPESEAKEEPRPAWHIHLRPATTLPLATDDCRRALRQGTLSEALFRGDDAPALRVDDQWDSHESLRRQADRVAVGLRVLGVRPGSRVCLYAANSLPWILAYLAAQRLGAVVNPCNPAYRQSELEHILTDSKPMMVLTDPERLPLVESVRARMPWITAVLDLEQLPLGDAALARPPVGTESPAVIIYTSGTTGRPKGALLDHGNLLAQARGAIEAWRWTKDDRLVLALPLFHVHGLAIGLHGTLLSGASAVLIRFSPEAVVYELLNGGTMFFGVPAMYQRLVEYLEERPADLSGVRLFVAGSAPLPPALFERAGRALGQPVLERYGITEGGIAVSNPYDGPRQPGRVGYPLPGVEVRLDEGDEVLLRGGQVFSGYLENPEASEEALRDGWLHTGDVGEIGPDGSLAIRGRIKEMIISGGFNVYPREVELVLETHPAVAEVAVAGVPSERWGEEVIAYVVAVEPVAGETLMAYARERLASYKCPRRVVFLAALPRNAMGKVQRSALGEA
ncbi:MAG TPA: AMP-binding protein [Chloroflexota bacterium]|nr:AMP-binding protein [Chloroflexota bacterium]